jgi:hypothetical protein
MKLPATIVLPAGPELRSADLIAAFGFTRQGLAYYRRRHGFPEPSGRTLTARYDTRAVTAWCAAHNCKIVFV